jgi:hypothetical protein
VITPPTLTLSSHKLLRPSLRTMDDMDTTRTFGGTVKTSNLAHNGFHDLLAMLPTGSGTGASAFFASTPGNTLDKDGKYEPEDYFIDQPVTPQQLVAQYASREAQMDVHGGDWADQTFGRSRVKVPATDSRPQVEPSPRPLPPIPNIQGLLQRSSPIQELPQSPRSAQGKPQTGSPTAKPQLRRVPAPTLSPSRQMVQTQRSPLSPPLSSAVAVSVLHSPIKDGLNATQRFTATVAHRFSAAASPLLTSPKSPSRKAPNMIDRSRGAGGLWDSPPNKSKPGRTDGKSGKLDKRLISWPMDFR